MEISGSSGSVLDQIVVHGHINFGSWCRMGDIAHWCRAFRSLGAGACMGSVLRGDTIIGISFTIGETGKSTIRSSTISGKSSTTSLFHDRRSRKQPRPAPQSAQARSASWIRLRNLYLWNFLYFSPVPVQKEVPGCSVSIQAQKPLFRLWKLVDFTKPERNLRIHPTTKARNKAC